ncbi:hypothetical protein PVAND_004448 [Polypedilum vanderplanki]|uniref:Reverse transcriptase Ty1/copia-type domain-containing protein n=1 Tax=Polypedilum vanderplanki TaxID=319348 RepID=A0A9J6BXR4_POLVA|nr:hypothetical protein PVAND_004448 [Polypedilum vanderplanki]
MGIQKEGKSKMETLLSIKARLVAQGYSQKYGEDYDEVFAPVTRSSTFRLLLAVSGRRKYYVKQFDIKTAFLNGELKEEIYLKQPPGYEINDQVLRLKKSLYGLKQAARVWNQTIHQKIVSEASLSDAKPSKIPLDVGYYKLEDEVLLEDNKENRKLIGMLLYVSTNSRPDISSSVSILSQKVVSPSRTDLNEVKRIISYLNSTRSLSLRLSSQDQNEEVKEKGVIQIKYVPAEDNIADMLTKALGAVKLKQLREAAGVINLE